MDERQSEAGQAIVDSPAWHSLERTSQTKREQILVATNSKLTEGSFARDRGYAPPRTRWAGTLVRLGMRPIAKSTLFSQLSAADKGAYKQVARSNR